MKASKPLLITQAILMYIAHLPFYIVLIGIRFIASEEADKVFGILLLVGLGLSILIMPIAIVNLIIAFISIFKGNTNPCLTTMIIKSVLMPWYVGNFLLGLLVVGVMGNPWLFIGIPFVLAIIVCSTYIFMIGTSGYEIAYFINRMKKKEKPVTALTIILLILLTVFTLDVASTIVLFIIDTKSRQKIELKD